MAFNRILYPNNSIIELESITTFNGFSNALICITDRYPCCSIAEEASWVLPDNTDVEFQSNFLQMQTLHQAVILSRNEGKVVPNGMFHCQIKDSFNATHRIYIGIYLKGLG